MDNIFFSCILYWKSIEIISKIENIDLVITICDIQVFNYKPINLKIPKIISWLPIHFDNLDIQTKLNGRLVRKSWNDMFEKQASKIDLENVPKFRKFLKEKTKWSLFLKVPKSENT